MSLKFAACLNWIRREQICATHQTAAPLEFKSGSHLRKLPRQGSSLSRIKATRPEFKSVSHLWKTPCQGGGSLQIKDGPLGVSGQDPTFGRGLKYDAAGRFRLKTAFPEFPHLQKTSRVRGGRSLRIEDGSPGVSSQVSTFGRRLEYKAASCFGSKPACPEFQVRIPPSKDVSPRRRVASDQSWPAQSFKSGSWFPSLNNVLSTRQQVASDQSRPAPSFKSGSHLRRS